MSEQNWKRSLGINVLEAARHRIKWTFETFSRIYISFSGGKDSTVMLHLVMEEAIKKNKRVGVLFVDLEGQYKTTIDHIDECMNLYRDHIDPYWVCLPIHLRNAVSQYQPHWVCWDPEAKSDWIRQPPEGAITDATQFPFYHHAMEFEELVPAFGDWYAQGELTCCFVGIRTDESLNRWRTVVRKKAQFENKKYTTMISSTLFNVYPVYDWRTADVWRYHGKFPSKPHNKLYDLMHRAGLTPHQMRICQPYGDDQRKGLWLFHLIEPETWGKVVARVNGANQGALYAQDTGNILGINKVTKPEGHTWESFAKLLLSSMPAKTRDHFEDKIAVFLKWYETRDYPGGIPDEADPKLEAARKAPSWRRICKSLLRNDYWCKGLSFNQHKSESYENYKKMMKKRRKKWGLI